MPVELARITSQNVIGKLTGSRYPNETVSYGGHWDAYGVGPADAQGRTIRPGASDDALGLAAMIEIARKFAAGPRPERTLLFAASFALLWAANEADDAWAVIGGTGIVIAGALLGLTFLASRWRTAQGGYVTTVVDDTAFYEELAAFDVTAADGVTTTQYQLDYVKVARKKTTSAKAARATAAGGREALRARTSRLGRLRFDKRSGTIKQLSVRAWKAQAARAAARQRRLGRRASHHRPPCGP